jgi:hypothetical protein
MGPIDYIVVEWTGKQPTGEAIPALLELVDNGIVRVLDLSFITKAEDGTVAEIQIDELGAEFAVFDGASSDLLGEDDIADAASVLEPGTSAAVLIWENTWAAPFAVALRKSGAELVASGRIPVQQIVASLEASA